MPVNIGPAPQHCIQYISYYMNINPNIRGSGHFQFPSDADPDLPVFRRDNWSLKLLTPLCAWHCAVLKYLILNNDFAVTYTPQSTESAVRALITLIRHLHHDEDSNLHDNNSNLYDETATSITIISTSKTTPTTNTTTTIPTIAICKYVRPSTHLAPPQLLLSQ